MKFGAYFAPHWPAGVTQKTVYNTVLDHISWAETLGYASAWTTEHHFATDPTYPAYGDGPFPAYDLVSDPLTFLGHAAARTSKIRLGTGVLVMHYDNPIRIAERAAMVDLLSGGRLELGLGRGSGLLEPAVFGTPADSADNYEKYFESIDILRKGLSGERFEHKGRFFQFPELAVVPSPEQRRVPIYLSNMSTQSVEYAAANGLSYASLASARGASGIERHNAAHDQFLRVAVENGQSTDHLDYPHILYCYVAPTDDEAIEMAEKSLFMRDGFGEAHYQSQRSGKQAPFSSGAGWKDKFAGQFKAQLETNLIGSPKTVAEKFAALKARIPSLNYLMAVIGVSTAPVEFNRRSMQLLATEVMPNFVDGAAAAKERSPA